MRIIWRSWSEAEAAYELDAMSSKLNWLNGHVINDPKENDVWLTTNGYDHKMGSFHKISWFAESVNYLENEYTNFEHNRSWNHRFHFNPHYAAMHNTSLQLLGCWWADELNSYNAIKANKKIDYVFGMVHGHKPRSNKPYDIGWIRSKVVEYCKKLSFQYYGSGWTVDDNYDGISGVTNTPDRFKNARKLMAPMKFVFCLENLYDQHYSVNYLTEKIFNGFLSYSVPIYIGCYNVEKLIDKSLFIDLRDFNLDIGSAVSHCMAMTDQEYDNYLIRIEQFLRTDAAAFTFNNRLLEIDNKINNWVNDASTDHG